MHDYEFICLLQSNKLKKWNKRKTYNIDGTLMTQANPIVSLIKKFLKEKVKLKNNKIKEIKSKYG